MQTQEHEMRPLTNEVRREFFAFLQRFEENGVRKYVELGKQMINNMTHIMIVQLLDFLKDRPDISEIVFREYYKYEPILNEVLTEFMTQREKDIGGMEEVKSHDEQKEKYHIAFDRGCEEDGDNSVRQLSCEKIGRLQSLRGTVTRTSEIRPELQVGVFRCKTCGKLSKPIPQQFKYTEPKICLTPNCDACKWEIDQSKSEFDDFQKLRVQENPSRIPPGAMPRSIDVILRNENTEKAQAGDICKIIGYLCVLPEISSMLKPGERTQVTTRSYDTRGVNFAMEGTTGIKGIRELNYKLIFIANNIVVENNQFNEVVTTKEDQEDDDVKAAAPQTQEQLLYSISRHVPQSDLAQFEKMRQNPRLYDDLAESLFPNIFGHPEIKKALLLQLIGGIHKKTANKINIRGDINILIVGDPSTAKSQFLKAVNRFVPRSVYTNGKSTSAAGLTATVTRDENGNVGIEAGALMLADNGICCIDEFDKMEIKDQVAIHEAMEQQTISIAKAGVFATLNARTSVLAAANPLFGRYDKSKSLKNNIDLSAPIMSRFDLFFVICDQAKTLTDNLLSQFIVEQHKGERAASLAKYDLMTIKNYLSYVRKIKPRLTLEAAELLRRYYIELREKDKSSQNTSYRITVRQLESMIRISEAFARMHMEFEVKASYVREAHRLLSCSILKLEKSPIELDEEENPELLQQTTLLNLGETNLLTKEIQRRENEERANRKITVSHDLYSEIKRNVLTLFKEKQSRHISREIDDEEQISEQSVCDYLLTVNYESGQLTNANEIEKMRKIFSAVLRKMYKEEKILMVAQDSSDPREKMLAVHPNYVD